eukprot:2361016-Pyramimonas_sp.AAC.1
MHRTGLWGVARTLAVTGAGEARAPHPRDGGSSRHRPLPRAPGGAQAPARPLPRAQVGAPPPLPPEPAPPP